MLIKERRSHHRRVCLIPVDCVDDKDAYKAFIVNISSTGALIESLRPIPSRKEVKMTFPHPKSYEEVSVIARIVWVGRNAFGVRFRRLAQREEQRSSRASQPFEMKSSKNVKEVTKMGKIRQKKIRWDASASPEVVKYRLYWAEDGVVNYQSEYAEVGNVSEVLLPRDVPSFPLTKGKIALGISAVSEAGNESDIVTMTVQLDFVPPEAPRDLQIEDV